MQEAAEPIAQLGPLLNEPPAMREQPAQVPDLTGRHPNNGDQVRREQLGQVNGSAAIGLDARRRDQLDHERVGHRDGGDQRDEQVMDLPGGGRGFEHDGIAGRQRGPRPGLEGRSGDAARREHDPLLEINGADDDVVFVQIERDEAGRDGGRRIQSRSPSSSTR
jgi:hypothetical protein